MAFHGSTPSYSSAGTGNSKTYTNYPEPKSRSKTDPNVALQEDQPGGT